MSASGITLRSARTTDLDNINRVVSSAVMCWNLPDRVKRLSLPSYHYNELDLDHFQLIIAEDQQKNITGVAAWAAADTKDTPANCKALLLHGLYIEPLFQHKGIGRQLLLAAERAAHAAHYDGLLVKAQDDATGFFLAQGMQKLAIENSSRDYANRFWKSI
ncbi:MAG: GNAT family N-acetyltransferase [Gammaproteobacteria bacterium]|nr:GNAT family N-acetyltransferase [Gammaproteobacteria bacterium]